MFWRKESAFLFLHSPLHLCYSKCGPRTHGIYITWELVHNADYWTPLKLTEAICILTFLTYTHVHTDTVILMHIKVRECYFIDR